jgi:hypothetical protein
MKYRFAVIMVQLIENDLPTDQTRSRIKKTTKPRGSGEIQQRECLNCEDSLTNEVRQVWHKGFFISSMKWRTKLGDDCIDRVRTFTKCLVAKVR